MKTKFSTPRSFLSAAGRSASTVSLIAVFACAAFAQQWTGPDGNNNITNANSGNVGVGTTIPQYKLDVANSVDKAQVRFGLGALDSGGFLFSNSPAHAVFSGGASWNGGWVAKAMSASFFQANNGAVTIFGNTGLTPGSFFTPTARLSINPSGYVGIGTAAPAGPIDVRDNSGRHVLWNDGINGHSFFNATTGGNVHLAANLYYNGTAWNRFNTGAGGGMWWAGSDGTLQALQAAAGSNPVSAFTTPLFIGTTGNVGIGTSTPGSPLEIVRSQPAITVAQVTNNNNAAGNGAVLRMFTSLNNALNLGAIGNAGTGGYAQINQEANLPLLLLTNNTERLRITGGGNIGIGNTNPTYKLDVAGEIRSSTGGFRFPDGSLQTTAASGGGGGVPSVFGRTGAVVAAANDYTWAQINKGTSSLADLTTRSATDLTSGTLSDARFPATLPALSGVNITSLNASNLGSGTVSTARLGSGTANSTTFLRGDNTWQAVTSSQWANGSGNINYTSGNVGIGTANPRSFAALDVNTSNSKALNTMDTTNGGLLLGYQGSTIQARQTNDGNNQNLILQNWGGNVGIGIASPQNKLHVGGSITVDGNINAKYQDLAEWVPSSEQLVAGTVVVLDTTKSNQVVSATVAYDTRVAGVISAQPGITLGEGGEGKVLVATTGRVRVKVDASRGPIQIGDLLVTSDVSGVAMKSEAVEFAGRKMHMPGTIIGKALEPLAKGSGEILVLLSLQ